MAGLEVLFTSVAPAITCAQDALICFLHWEVLTQGYRALGTCNQLGPNDKKSELLPAGWNSNKDLYVLRYESKDESRKLLVKAVTSVPGPQSSLYRFQGDKELGISTLQSSGNQELVAAATCQVPSIILGHHLRHGHYTVQVVGAQLGRHIPPASLLSYLQATQG